MKRRKVWIGVGAAAAIAALLAVGVACAWLWGGNNYGYGYGMYGMMGGYGLPWGTHGFGGGILMFLFWGLILGGGAWLLATGLHREEQPMAPVETPLEIARRRYARGEIDREEFDRIRQALLG
jgi:putative membrane protein